MLIHLGAENIGICGYDNQVIPWDPSKYGQFTNDPTEVTCTSCKLKLAERRIETLTAERDGARADREHLSGVEIEATLDLLTAKKQIEEQCEMLADNQTTIGQGIAKIEEQQREIAELRGQYP